MPKRNSKKPREKADHPESSRSDERGDFVLRDRSGKLHVLGARKGTPATNEAVAGAVRPPKFPGKPSAKIIAPEKRERGLPPPVILPDAVDRRPLSKKKRDSERAGPRGNETRKDERPNRKDRRREQSLGPWADGGKKRDSRDRPGRDPQARADELRRNSAALRADPSYTKLKATIDKNKRGFGFLQFENRDYEDAFLAPREAEKYFHGDRVEALVSESGEVVDLRVLQHRFREVVGRFYPIGEFGQVVYERKKAREEIALRGPNLGAKSRDWIRVKLEFSEGEFGGAEAGVVGEIQQVYGPELPSEADIGMVAAEFNLEEHHSPEAVAEAKAQVLDLQDPERTDLRHLPFITIDGETARDFDDAIFVERDGDGFVLWVAIADVSHYVKEGTTLNKEAYARATSVYFPERAFHMLPGALSENLCSLRPNEPRLTMTAKIHLDARGKRTQIEVMNTLIESKRRATYNQIQAEWEANGKNPAWKFAPHFELYRLIRAQRHGRGSIDFDLPEAEIRVDAAGDPISILQRPRLDAHRLIEEFMVSANEAVTEWAIERKSPFIYRVHEEPSFAALERFRQLCAHNGVDVVIDDADISGSLNRVIQTLEGHPSQTLLNMALLRSMPRAAYSAAYGIHFGLASKAYTHFTSPIRRYPDLIVHRILKELIAFGKNRSVPSETWTLTLNQKLEEMAEHCSYRERIASDAERESIKLKQVRIMRKEVGNEHDGKVNGMMENGIFVGLQVPFVEGVIPKEGLHDDQYEFIEDRMLYFGRRKKRMIQIGDAVKIRVARVDFDLRTIDFEMLEHTPRAGRTELKMPSREPRGSAGGERAGGGGRGRDAPRDKKRRGGEVRGGQAKPRSEGEKKSGGRRKRR